MNITLPRAVIEQALAALEYMDVTAEHYVDNRIPEAAIATLRTALEQPEQEPVAWMLGDKFYKVKQCRLFCKNPGEEIPGQIPLYTAPPQRKPLTDDEIQAIWKNTFESGASPNTFARAIEVAHGIKEPT